MLLKTDFCLPDDRGDGEYNGVGLAEISKIFVTQDDSVWLVIWSINHILTKLMQFAIHPVTLFISTFA